MCRLGEKKLTTYSERFCVPLVAGYVKSHTAYVFLAEYKREKCWLEFTWNPVEEYSFKISRKWCSDEEELS